VIRILRLTRNALMVSKKSQSLFFNRMNTLRLIITKLMMVEEGLETGDDERNRCSGRNRHSKCPWY
jgi:hypothetical protein